MYVPVLEVSHLEKARVFIAIDLVLHVTMLIELQQYNAVGPVLDRHPCHVNLRIS